MTTKTSIPSLLILCLCAACGTTDGGGGGDALEIVGSYTDDFGYPHEITADTWTMDPAVFEIETFDNDEGFLVARNHEDNEFDPGKYSRMDWTWDGDDLYFCQVAFAADNAEQAEAATPADVDDLAMGCGGMFPWSQLIPN